MLIFCLAWVVKAYCLDWKAMHEAAGKEDLNLAQVKFEADGSRSLDDLYEAGLACLNQHRNDEAENIFNKIIEFDSQYYPAKWGIAEVLRRKHQLDEAQRITKEVIREHADFSPAYITLAYIEYLKLNLDQAVNLALLVIKRGAKNVDLSNFSRAYLIYGGAKGLIAHRGGPLAKMFNGTLVLPALKKAQKLQPDSAVIFLGLGGFYVLAPGFAGGDLDKGIGLLQKAIKVDPNLADAYARLAQAYKIKGEPAKYAEYLNKALEIDPENELALDTQSQECKYACRP